ncbi:hypothetical protein HKCCE3408_09690 [Rhodobacterales bacterium HKCCE3408]|nr:hypothetical protein [Rhodobacterales bacterium HKCCE3408]
MSIQLDHVFYDDQYRAFRATATLRRGAERREIGCYWPGPAASDFARVARGLADDAIARIG